MVTLRALALFLCLTTAHAADILVRDDRGQDVRLTQPAQRIISLAPHLTEDLFAIGAGVQIVGAVEFSDYPAAARKIPRVGGYNGFDLERIRALKPDLIVAWLSGNPQAQLAQIEALGIPLFMDDSRQLLHVPAVLARLGQLTGQTAGANRAAASFRQRLSALRTRYAGKQAVRMFFQVWERPLLTVNREQIISDAMRICGAVNVFGDLPSLVPTVDDEAVLAANPELIVTSAVAGSKNDALAHWRRWPRLAAVQRDQLVVLPKDLLERMGPRLVEGTEALCTAVDKARQP